MKKFFIFTILAFTTLISCQKDAATKSSEQLSSAKSSSVSSIQDIVLTDDLTGLPLENLCTGEIMTALSGDAVLNFAPDGNLRSLDVHNFVFQAPDGTIYRNNYIITFELISSGGFINTYKMISNPQGSGTHWVLEGQFKVTNISNGVFTVQFDKFFIKCL